VGPEFPAVWTPILTLPAGPGGLCRAVGRPVLIQFCCLFFPARFTRLQMLDSLLLPKHSRQVRQLQDYGTYLDSFVGSTALELSSRNLTPEETRRLAGLERGIQNWLFFLDQTPARGAFSRQPSSPGQGCTCLGLNETGNWKRPFIRPQRRPYC